MVDLNFACVSIFPGEYIEFIQRGHLQNTVVLYLLTMQPTVEWFM